MTRNEANVILAAILSTVAASPEGAPSGVMYAVLMGRCTLGDYQDLLGICKSTGLVTVSGHLVSITNKGREIVKKIDAAAGV